MRPAVTTREFRKLIHLLTFFSCLFSNHLFSQPIPQITGEETPCRGEVYYYYTPYNGNSWLWSISTGGTIISPHTDNGVYVQWDGPMNTAQWIRVQEDDGILPPVATTMDVYIAKNVLSCENTVHVSLDQTGAGIVTPEMLLDGNYLSYGNFTVMLSLANGVQLGNQINCSQVGRTLIGKVTDDCTGNHCWSNVKVEDKKAPLWVCPSVPDTVDCDTDLDLYPHPPVQDNCDPYPLISLSGLQVNNGDVCQGVTIIRTWVAADYLDNESICTQVLYISPDQEIIFPDDRAWLCTQYSDYPNITNPTKYLGTSYLEETGSGVPIGALGIYCPYSFGQTDDTIFNCGNTIKIVRTWTVLNWCTQQVITQDSYGNDNQQVIKIIDATPPTIVVPPVTIRITEPGPSAIACRSRDLLPPPTVTDDCGEVTIRIFTAIGEVTYANGLDGSQGGYVPSPGLGLGPHIVTYMAIDACGNERLQQVIATVVDDEAPIAICDQLTKVSLDQFGFSEAFATTFDDGSTDNCCIGNMLVKRMGEPDSYFAPTVPFHCDDEEVMVVFRVIDCFGNWADCMVQVLIEDKLPPICIPPSQKIVPCNQLPPDITDAYIQSFGQALAVDNCNVEIAELPYTENINACGEGHIIRRFKAIDEFGIESVGNCEQHIYVTPVSDWLINFPPNWYGECGEPVASIDLLYGEFGCEQLAYTFSDQYFAISPDSACYKIVRTWEVINWCTYDPNLNPVIIPTHPDGVLVDEDDYNNYGHYIYQQIIKIHDTNAPILTAPFTYEFCTDDADCLSGHAFLPIEVDGECSDQMDIVYHIDLDKNGTYDRNGLGFFDGYLPLGVHSIRYLVEDGCGNESEILFDFEIKDCKKPSPVCVYGLIVEIMQTGMIEICAESLLEYAVDNCPGNFKVSFSSDVADVCRVFDCDDVGQIPVQIWVTDAGGNQDYCDNVIILQDNLTVCNGVPLVGMVAVPGTNEPVEGVMVNVSSNTVDENYQTLGTGMYGFDGLLMGQDYTITPVKDNGYLNGVSTYDLVLISKHILAVELLNSPYKMIAADVNNSKSVTTFDLVELRKMILLINDAFPNNNSWRFIDKAYQFPQPFNPWAEVFPEVININNLASPVNNADFVAVKIGDVNGSVVPNNNIGQSGSERSSDMLYFGAEEQSLAAGQTVEVVFKAKDFHDVYGFQFTIDFDKEKLSFLQINETALANGENYGLTLLGAGAIPFLWFETEMVSLEDGTPVVSLQFEAKTDCQLHEVINISSRFTPAVAYLGEAMAEWQVALDFEENLTSVNSALAEGFALHQNVPNPFISQTVIAFELPVAGQAKLTVYDAKGTILQEFEGMYGMGRNELVVNKKGLPTTGALFYKLESAGMVAVRKMTLIE